MTKLEEKLLQLGYKRIHVSIDYVTYKKIYDNKIDLNIELNNIETKIINWYLFQNEFTIKKQEQINDLQQAFNKLQQDLEVLKGCE